MPSIHVQKKIRYKKLALMQLPIKYTYCIYVIYTLHRPGQSLEMLPPLRCCAVSDDLLKHFHLSAVLIE